MSPSTVQVLVACSNRKRQQAPPELRLRSVRRGPRERVQGWIERVDTAQRQVEARELYAGDNWFIARRMELELAGRAQLWALSAGFGLVRSDDRIAPYGATLSAGYADSVLRQGDAVAPRVMRRHWWRELSHWEGPRRGGTRTISALAARLNGDSVVVCAGADYIDAVAEDLTEAVAGLKDPDRLVVFGSGRCPEVPLRESYVAIPAKLRTVVGGTLGSLSTRTAERVLQATGPEVTAAEAREAVHRMSAGVEDLPIVRRTKLSDDAVTKWISEHRGLDSSLTKSVALRRFRREGFACEQRRFYQLFTEVGDALP